MWCSLDAVDVDRGDLVYDSYWGWVHHLGATYHTTRGTLLERSHGALHAASSAAHPGPPVLAAITFDLRR
jgi:hypothetical protein